MRLEKKPGQNKRGPCLLRGWLSLRKIARVKKTVLDKN
jgi:hypothetical protein